MLTLDVARRAAVVAARVRRAAAVRPEVTLHGGDGDARHLARPDRLPHRRAGHRRRTTTAPPFTIVVNGMPIFVRGANWIPDDAFLTRSTAGPATPRRIGQAVDAGLNLLRVWGGGLYESDDFYDLCDELGLLVWQDFLFACAAYPEEEPLRPRGRGRGARAASPG